MRIILPLAASLVLGGAATAAQAAPAMPQPNVLLGQAATTVDWHPSTRHWDHHFHSHQESSRYRVPTEVERQIQRNTTRLRNPEWSGYWPYAGRRARHH